MIIVLDTFPLSSMCKPPATPPSMLDRCRQWVHDCQAAGHDVLVPAICYYEVLRELGLRQASSQIARLKTFCFRTDCFITLVTSHLETAARIWGNARRGGVPTASPQALDADVILAAQVLGLSVPAPELVVATTNPGHLSRYVPSALWTSIVP